MTLRWLSHGLESVRLQMLPGPVVLIDWMRSSSTTVTNLGEEGGRTELQFAVKLETAAGNAHQDKKKEKILNTCPLTVVFLCNVFTTSKKSGINQCRLKRDTL